MRKFLKIFIITFFVFIYTFICKIDNIPNKVILYSGENFNIGKFLGISATIDNKDCNEILTSASYSEIDLNSEETAEIKLLNLFTVKKVSIDIIDEITVIPVGQVSGLELYTDGVLVVGMSEIRGEDNKKYKPYENSGIEEGSRITKIDDKQIIDTEELTNIVNNSNGKDLKIEYIKDNTTYTTYISPVKYVDNTYKLGLWVRDSSAGIGTMTFYEPKTGNFAALGHGISDIDTGNLIEISDGNLVTAKILSITKGIKGTPGKIQGSIEKQLNIGSIYKNTELGIYGNANNISNIKLDYSKEMKIAKRDEIETGKAYIYCSLDGTSAKEYEIEIEKIYLNNNENNKSMFIKVKDEELLEKTGGIIQGMSGAPIIQNNKLIGAITNVLVNDPTQGYAVFADMMVSEMNE